MPSRKQDPRWQRSNTSVYNVAYHVIFCPKYRKKVLVGKVEERLKALLSEEAAELGVRIDTMEVLPDHVHLFVKGTPALTPQRLVHRLKGYTSRVLRQEFQHLRRLPSLWTRSYYIESIGHISEETIRQYIEDQKDV
jgi:putative transposase